MSAAVFSERPLTAEDAAFVVEAHRLPHARGFLSAPPGEQRVIESLDTPGIVRRIVTGRDGERLGLWIASVANGWLAELHLVVAVRPRCGIGRFAVRSAKRFAFEEAGVHRLWLEVAASNLTAQRLYESEGFVHEGTYRDGFQNPAGTYEDLRHYGILESEYAAGL